ncbi:hypothetical protein GCM10022205_57960 [Spinactinospora alkalitolerans]
MRIGLVGDVEEFAPLDERAHRAVRRLRGGGHQERLGRGVDMRCRRVDLSSGLDGQGQERVGAQACGAGEGEDEPVAPPCGGLGPDALRRAQRAGWGYVVLDGTLIAIDRAGADRSFYSGKHKKARRAGRGRPGRHTAVDPRLVSRIDARPGDGQRWKQTWRSFRTGRRPRSLRGPTGRCPASRGRIGES